MTAPAHSTGGGSFLTRKYGPLPTWAWMGLVLLVALAYSIWQRNKSAAAATPPASSVPDQTPPTIFQLFDSTNVFTPPAGGRDNPPPAPPPGPTPVPPPSVPPGENPIPVPPRPPGPTPPTPVPAPSGQWVSISKFTSKNPVWNSTLWGIASRLLGNGSQWGRIWNAPQNASLKSRRKDPKFIQPGDRVWVPSK